MRQQQHHDGVPQQRRIGIRFFFWVWLGGLLPIHQSLSQSLSSNLPQTPSIRSDVNEAKAPVSQTSTLSTQNPQSSGRSRWGMSYAVFFSGPGLNGVTARNPNHIGMPSDDGLYTSNTVSFRYRVTERWSADLQTRTRLVFNDDRAPRPGLEPFRALRWENPSLGISGDLTKGADWSLKGAVNTDLPYFLGEPFAGFTSINRTTVLAPGMFAAFRWSPQDSRWSFFSIVNPRWYIYRDRTAVEPMFIRAGRIPQNKREIDVALRPALNYRATSRVDLSIGSALSYNKQVGSGWNPLRVSNIQNGPGPEWRFDPIPIQVGTTFNLNKNTRLFSYIQGFPIAEQRIDARGPTPRTIPFEETLSLGFDLTGSVF